MKLKTYFLETRPQFLILSLVLGFLGATIAWHDGYLHMGYALLATLGIVLAHVSVNTLNDYYDYRSGVDLATRRTPFSGGSGILPATLLSPREVFRLGVGSLVTATLVGIYFVIARGWPLLPLLAVAAILVLLYTPVILRTNWPEWSPGVGLGLLPVMGAYFVQTSAYTWPLLVAAVPSGILVHNLLFLNEFPDAEADRKGKRKTTPITIGLRKSSRLYSALTILVYVWIAAWVVVGVMPVYALLALLTLPMAMKAIKGSRDYQDMSKLVPALASNVLVVLLTQFLLGVGYILATVL